MKVRSQERGDINAVDFSVFFNKYESSIAKEFTSYWPEISWRVGTMTEPESKLYKDLKELLVELFLTCRPNRRIDFAYLVIHSLLPDSKPYMDHVDVISEVFRQYVTAIGIRSPLSQIPVDALERFTQYYVKVLAITYARMVAATLRYSSSASIIFQIAQGRSEQYKTGTSYPRDIGDALLTYSSDLSEDDEKVVDAERNAAKIINVILTHTGSFVKPIQPSKDVLLQVVIDGTSMTMNTASLVELMSAKRTISPLSPSKLHAINRTLLGEVLDFKEMALKEKAKKSTSK